VKFGKGILDRNQGSEDFTAFQRLHLAQQV
jgi:hypothetical protein